MLKHKEHNISVVLIHKLDPFCIIKLNVFERNFGFIIVFSNVLTILSVTQNCDEHHER